MLIVLELVEMEEVVEVEVDLMKDMMTVMEVMDINLEEVDMD